MRLGEKKGCQDHCTFAWISFKTNLGHRSKLIKDGQRFIGILTRKKTFLYVKHVPFVYHMIFIIDVRSYNSEII